MDGSYQCPSGSQSSARLTSGITGMCWYSQRSCREFLCVGQVPNAELYGTHDFRRGHAKDLQDSGAPYAVILAAGEWKGRAVVSYLDLGEIERDVALEAAMLSDDEGSA